MFHNDSSSVKMKCEVQAVFVLCVKLQAHRCIRWGKISFDFLTRKAHTDVIYWYRRILKLGRPGRPALPDQARQMTWLWKLKWSSSEVSGHSEVCQNPLVFVWLPLRSSLSQAAFSVTSHHTTLRAQLVTINFLAHNCAVEHHKTTVSLGALCK